METRKKHSIFIVFFDVFTVIIWFLLLLEFFTREVIYLPTVLTSAYILLLTFYASDKEIRRWRKKLRGERHGEFFVFLWMLTLILILSFYLFYGQKVGYIIPRDLATITGSVFVIYIITDIFKEEFQKKIKKQ
ncbi:MAG: hypothetical protein WC528_03560 [Patescibacteria group bacterium]